MKPNCVAKKKYISLKQNFSLKKYIEKKQYIELRVFHCEIMASLNLPIFPLN